MDITLSFPTQAYNVRGLLSRGMWSWVPFYQSFLEDYFSKHDPSNPVYSDPQVIDSSLVWELWKRLSKQKTRIRENREEQMRKLWEGRRRVPLYYSPDLFMPYLFREPFYFIPSVPGMQPLDNIPKVAGLLSPLVYG